MYTVYDSKSKAYLKPFIMRTKGEAIRSFEMILRDREHPFTLNPEDYTLFELGKYDDNTAHIACYDTPDPVGKAIEFLQESPLFGGLPDARKELNSTQLREGSDSGNPAE